jgi:anaerobic carbon-monoxide dehydrogenase iron sulfur subunit
MDQRFTDIHFRKRRTVTANPKVCAGCRTCEVICSLTHEGAIDPERSRIRVRSNAFAGSFHPQICHQCSDVPCYYACPETAIKIGSLGEAVIEEEKCTGCRACEKACPFKVIRFDAEKRKALKCDLCKGTPECVRWCPVSALGVTDFGGEIPR